MFLIDCPRIGSRNARTSGEVRSHIDALDQRLIELIAQRGDYVRQAARFRHSDRQVAAPDRLEQIIAKARHLANRWVPSLPWWSMCGAR
ncbi:chorismate mutase [Bifidobacterium sp.]|uniref:chorismate mutase n=1 Tax=Bifidobacterium sp. TaxID=41200 RepID=UPI00343B8D67